jgi:hypothetical protein
VTARIVGGVTHHLQPIGEDEEPSAEDLARWGEDATDSDEELAPIGRPPWWRWVAIALVLALVLGTPVAYAWSVLAR